MRGPSPDASSFVWPLQLGLGPRSSAIVAGYTHVHRGLEEELAALKGTEDCLLFPTGALYGPGGAWMTLPAG